MTLTYTHQGDLITSGLQSSFSVEECTENNCEEAPLDTEITFFYWYSDVRMEGSFKRATIYFHSNVLVLFNMYILILISKYLRKKKRPRVTQFTQILVLGTVYSISFKILIHSFVLISMSIIHIQNIY